MKKLLQRKANTKYVKPVIKLFSSVVPKSFTEKFPSWDKELASKNLKIIEA